MKKSFLLLTLFLAIGFTKVNAQIVNNDFESWSLDTFYLPANSLSTLPADTIMYYDPTGWSSSNTLSDLDSLGSKVLVTQTADAYSGNSAVQMITDTINLPVVSGLPFFKITLPGFVLNGRFAITASSLISSGTISPMSIKGAGQPFTQRLNKIKGFYKYAPVFNTNTQHNDTCLIWATLRKGDILVADARFKSTDATSGYQAFESTFTYYTCDVPDTLVVLLASSVPNVQSLLGGSSGLQRGSVLKVDSIYYETLANNYNFPPIAVADLATTTKNTPVDVLVKSNDDDCNDGVGSLILALATQAAHGTAALGAGLFTYTPANNFVGLDSFFYTLSDGVNTTSPTRVRVTVANSTGINETSEVPVIIFPVPASDLLNVQFENQGKTIARVFDMIGNEVITANLTKNTNQLNTAPLANGVYALQIVTEKGEVIARSKFTINK